MKSIYVGSNSEYSGKSLVCICLGSALRAKGKKVGYMKPVGVLPALAGKTVTDEDALFMKEYFGLKEALEDVCPVVLTHDLKMSLARGRPRGLREKIMESFRRVGKGKDVVLLGGGRTMDEGRMLGVPAEELIRETKSRLVFVERYEENRGLDTVLAVKDRVGESFSGLILNRIGVEAVEFVRKTIVPVLEREGVSVLGIIPDDPVLKAVSVGDLASHLGAEVITARDRLDELVHNFSVGAMSLDAAISRFRKVHDKALITGGDRADLQIAALETSTRCLVLTGGMYPQPLIQSKADEMKVPILVTKDDTLTTVEKIDALIGRPRIREKEKLERAMKLFRENVSVKKLAGVL
ncbi:MAG: phosphotransacetylase family protein [bacterium]